MSKKSVVHQPRAPSEEVNALLEKALELHRLEQHAEAASLYKKALQLDPHDGASWSNLGTALRAMGHADAALCCLKKAIVFAPNKPSFLTNYGNILTDMDRKEEALAAHVKACQIRPDDFLIRKNYATSLREFAHYEQALLHYEIACSMQPNNDFVKWDRALTYLHLGHYKKGWEAFEVRWAIGKMDERPAEAPKWNGESLKGKTILVHGEQGFGDTILCSRYIPMVKMRGGRIIFECKEPLHKLFSKIHGIEKIVEYGQVGEPFDYQISIMSLPGIFKTNLDTIPPAPDLLVPDTPPPHAKQLLESANHDFKVGIIWSGSITFKGNKKRAVSIDRFLALASIPGVQFYSLQKGPCEIDLYNSGADTVIWDLSKDLNDFTDTASIVDQLDLVIMTDSSVAHLAGSIGTPVWNLLNYKPYWLYLSYREDCPWYPSMRLFRQTDPGNWDKVFERVAIELEKAVALKKAGLWKEEQNATLITKKESRFLLARAS